MAPNSPIGAFETLDLGKTFTRQAAWGAAASGLQFRNAKITIRGAGGYSLESSNLVGFGITAWGVTAWVAAVWGLQSGNAKHTAGGRGVTAQRVKIWWASNVAAQGRPVAVSSYGPN